MGGVDSHHVSHKALSVPPPTEKVFLEKRGGTRCHVVALIPHSRRPLSAEWTLWPTESICLCVGGGGGGGGVCWGGNGGPWVKKAAH